MSSGLNEEILAIDLPKKITLVAFEFLSRIEAGGFKYKKDFQPIDESALLLKLARDIENVIKTTEAYRDGVLFLIDEADKPGAKSNLGLICKLLTEELTRRGHDRLCIGVAGLPVVLRKLKDSHESSARLFRTMDLKPLEFKERIEVIERALKHAYDEIGFKVSITQDAMDFIANLSEGYPHFLQEFSHCAYEQDSDNVIDMEDVNYSLFSENGAFDQLGRKFFDQYYAAPYSDDYRKVLDVMSEHFDNWVSRATIIKESSLKIGTVDNALRALKTKKIVIQHESRRGEYRLPTRSFAVWIRAKKTAFARRPAEPGLFEE